MTSIRLDADKCVRCKTCVDACFLSCIVWDEAGNCPVLKYGDDCQVCGVCETICPTGALYISPDWPAKHKPRLLAEPEVAK